VEGKVNSPWIASGKKNGKNKLQQSQIYNYIMVEPMFECQMVNHGQRVPAHVEPHMFPSVVS
jgi:hypothetical protein